MQPSPLFFFSFSIVICVTVWWLWGQPFLRRCAISGDLCRIVLGLSKRYTFANELNDCVSYVSRRLVYSYYLIVVTRNFWMPIKTTTYFCGSWYIWARIQMYCVALFSIQRFTVWPCLSYVNIEKYEIGTFVMSMWIFEISIIGTSANIRGKAF